MFAIKVYLGVHKTKAEFILDGKVTTLTSDIIGQLLCVCLFFISTIYIIC